MMDHCDGHDHVAKDAKRRNPREQSEGKTQSAEEFRGNGQKCEYGRNVQDSRKEAHRAGKAVSTEPAKHLLCAVGEENHSQGQSENSYCRIVVGSSQFTNHEHSIHSNFAAPVGQTEIRCLSLYEDSFYRDTFWGHTEPNDLQAVHGGESPEGDKNVRKFSPSVQVEQLGFRPYRDVEGLLS
jgi:hypothetical protein